MTARDSFLLYLFNATGDLRDLPDAFCATPKNQNIIRMNYEPRFPIWGCCSPPKQAVRTTCLHWRPDFDLRAFYSGSPKGAIPAEAGFLTPPSGEFETSRHRCPVVIRDSRKVVLEASYYAIPVQAGVVRFAPESPRTGLWVSPPPPSDSRYTDSAQRCRKSEKRGSFGSLNPAESG